jgi:hypothetical protein
MAIPLGYLMARGNPDLVNFIHSGVELRKLDGTITALYDYWILGKNAVPQPPR